MNYADSMRSLCGCLLTLLCLILVGCRREPLPPPSTSADPVKSGRLRYFDLFNLDVRDIPWMMAMDDLTAQGYTVEKTFMTSGALIADALSRGSADLAMASSQAMWIAIGKGAGVRTIADFAAYTNVLAASTRIQDCSELDGRPLAVAGPRNLSRQLLDLYFKQHCPGSVPRILVIPESSARAAALLAGQVDAEIVPVEELIKLQLQAPGKFHRLASLVEGYPRLHKDAFHIRTQWAQENPQLVGDFLTALLKAQRRVSSDPGLLASEAVRRLSLDPAEAAAVARAHVQEGIWDGNGGLTTESVQDTIDLFVTLGALRSGLQARDVVDLSHLEAVLERIGRQ